ncbi:hypothetical protein F3Y22_tig00001509pilonHSYRG00015 [Hibiscus syriacus]|uniref:Reverse transcriptase Ty1/copia-type domain-containing protein n=1 Tax=Hibiscus syriacus TaxID=106335 RepID=A0A6A3CV17_HIBSY|nr:hypothetical protein F3Y22_tig00001509pilonHSYRG00015 [Hibiscus syriacus]
MQFVLMANGILMENLEFLVYRHGSSGTNGSNRGRGCGHSSGHPQCHLCGKFGHVVYKYYYRFDHTIHGNAFGTTSGSQRGRGGSRDDGGTQGRFTYGYHTSTQALTHLAVGHGGVDVFDCKVQALHTNGGGELPWKVENFRSIKALGGGTSIMVPLSLVSSPVQELSRPDVDASIPPLVSAQGVLSPLPVPVDTFLDDLLDQSEKLSVSMLRQCVEDICGACVAAKVDDFCVVASNVPTYVSNRHAMVTQSCSVSDMASNCSGKKCDRLVYLLIYVDDIIVTGSDYELQSVITSLNRVFSLKDLRRFEYFLGIRVTVLSQRKCIEELLCQFCLNKAKALPTPMIANCKLSVSGGVVAYNPTDFRSIEPLDEHFLVVKRIICYLQDDRPLVFVSTLVGIMCLGYLRSNNCVSVDN